jgi:hypothetical protein
MYDVLNGVEDGLVRIVQLDFDVVDAGNVGPAQRQVKSRMRNYDVAV